MFGYAYGIITPRTMFPKGEGFLTTPISYIYVCNVNFFNKKEKWV